MWLVVALAGIAIAGWGSFALPIWWPLWAVYLMLLLNPARRQRTVAAVLRLAATRREMMWAMLELERCSRLEAEGIAAPAADAHAAILRIQRTREEALAVLHDMSYRARFRASIDAADRL